MFRAARNQSISCYGGDTTYFGTELTSRSMGGNHLEIHTLSWPVDFNWNQNCGSSDTESMRVPYMKSVSHAPITNVDALSCSGEKLAILRQFPSTVPYAASIPDETAKKRDKQLHDLQLDSGPPAAGQSLESPDYLPKPDVAAVQPAHTDPARHTAQDWQRIRKVFKRLYVDEDKALSEVISELKLNYGFEASAQTFKKRIARWGFDKNLKQHEVEHILGIQARRRAHGKETNFTLRGRPIDMGTVYRYQKRKGLATSVAISNYLSGRSKECRDLRPLTPHDFESQAWRTPNKSYEHTLRAFGDLFRGLVDTQYYWLEKGEIVMPLVALRGEVADVCCSLVASKNVGFSTVALRKLSLLLESIVYTDDAWTHCRFIYTLWVLSTANRQPLVKALLSHLHGLVTALVDKPYPQSRFVQHYSNLEPDCAMRLAADMITFKAEMVNAIQVEDSVAFKLRSLEYDVFWREREQGTRMSLNRALDLLHRCNEILGLMAVETLTILRIVLEDFAIPTQEPLLVCQLMEDLKHTELLTFNEATSLFSFDKVILGIEAASELASVFCLTGHHDTEAWIFERLFLHQGQTQSCLRREYNQLSRISCCPRLSERHHAKAWLLRKQDIENAWLAEVEAVASTAELLQSCLPASVAL